MDAFRFHEKYLSQIPAIQILVRLTGQPRRALRAATAKETSPC